MATTKAIKDVVDSAVSTAKQNLQNAAGLGMVGASAANYVNRRKNSSGSSSKDKLAKLVGATASTNPYVKDNNTNTLAANPALADMYVTQNGSPSGASSGTAASTNAAASTEAQAGSGTSSLDEAKKRLLDSLDYTYGRKQELSDKSYDRSISQTDNAMLSRGMQRSSYSQQVLANMAKQKIEAAGDIESEKIAAYNTGVNQLEQQEREQQNWEKNYALQQESLAQQKAESEWNKSYADRQIAISALQAAAAAGNKKVSDDLLKRAGISRQDYNQWIKSSGKKSSSGGGGRSSNPGTNNTNTDTGGNNSLNSFVSGLLNYQLPTTQQTTDDKKKKQKPTSNGLGNGTTAIE